MSAVAESVENVVVPSGSSHGRGLVDRPVDHSIPAHFELDAGQPGVNSHQLTLKLRKMGARAAGVANPVIEDITRPAPADVDAIIFGQTKIEDLGAVVIEWNALAPSDLSQLLFSERRRHCHILMNWHD